MGQCELCDHEATVYYRIADMTFCNNHYLLAVAQVRIWLKTVKARRAIYSPTPQQLLQNSLRDPKENL